MNRARIFHIVFATNPIKKVARTTFSLQQTMIKMWSTGLFRMNSTLLMHLFTERIWYITKKWQRRGVCER